MKKTKKQWSCLLMNTNDSFVDVIYYTNCSLTFIYSFHNSYILLSYTYYTLTQKTYDTYTYKLPTFWCSSWGSTSFVLASFSPQLSLESTTRASWFSTLAAGMKSSQWDTQVTSSSVGRHISIGSARNRYSAMFPRCMIFSCKRYSSLKFTRDVCCIIIQERDS